MTVVLVETEVRDDVEEMGRSEVAIVCLDESLEAPPVRSSLSELKGATSDSMDWKINRLAGLFDGDANPSAASILLLGGLRSFAFRGLLRLDDVASRSSPLSVTT